MMLIDFDCMSQLPNFKFAAEFFGAKRVIFLAVELCFVVPQTPVVRLFADEIHK